MKDKLLLIRNQLKMGNRLSFAEAMLLQRAIDILVYGAGNASAQSPIDHGYRPECECSGCKATARICTELAGNSTAIPDERTAFNERNNGEDCPLAGRDAKSAAWLAWIHRAKLGVTPAPVQVDIEMLASALKNAPLAPSDNQGRPRAPVVPPAIEPDYKVIKSILPTANPDEYACCIAADMWNACRAAMLQGVEPVSNHDELALYYLQGQKDGLEWAAQLAEANHPLTGDWLYDDPLELAKAIRKGPDMSGFAGSSPVSPGGWINCSERMPDDGQHVIILCDGAFVLYAQYRDGEFFDVVRNGEEFFETHSRNVTDWMPLPEPPQEVNRG
ncbi:Eaa protein [Salmonella enterica subsp. enterica serovar Braenderup]|nr:Eaa protein [Salmonella enterica subsp. enterica serovar Braenderup]